MMMLDRNGPMPVCWRPDHTSRSEHAVMPIRTRPPLIPAALAAALSLAAGPAGAAGASGSADVAGRFVSEHGTTAHPVGDVTGHYDAAIGVLSYSINYVGLSGPVIAAHIHGPTSPTQPDAPVIRPISRPYASPISGRVTLTPEQAAELGRGELYVNLHTTASPEGEARARLTER